MIKLEDINSKITFEPNAHTYKNEKGESLISTSTLLNLYKPKFDEHGFIAKACAKKEGISVKDILLKWEKTKNEGLARGKSFHSQVEHYLKTGEILNEDYKDVVEQVRDFGLKGQIHCEVPMHSPSYLIGGTADLLLLFDDNIIELEDWKTNKSIEKKSKYGNKLLYPLDDYDDCSINVYTFQLNIYKFMLEEHGYKVRKITLNHINPETRKIDRYPIKDSKKDTVKLLNHYFNMMKW